jgi:hypothetical protein
MMKTKDRVRKKRARVHKLLKMHRLAEEVGGYLRTGISRRGYLRSPWWHDMLHFTS